MYFCKTLMNCIAKNSKSIFTYSSCNHYKQKRICLHKTSTEIQFQDIGNPNSYELNTQVCSQNNDIIRVHPFLIL